MVQMSTAAETMEVLSRLGDSRADTMTVIEIQQSEDKA